MDIQASEKDRLLGRLYEKPNEYLDMEEHYFLIAEVLHKDGFIKLVKAYVIAARINKKGIAFYESGGYSKDESKLDKKEKKARNKIARKDIITWIISLLAVILSFLLGKYFGCD